MAYDIKRVERRRQMPLEERVEKMESALDSLAPASHNFYECLRKIQRILSVDRFDTHVLIEKCIKDYLDKYDRERMWCE